MIVILGARRGDAESGAAFVGEGLPDSEVVNLSLADESEALLP